MRDFFKNFFKISGFSSKKLLFFAFWDFLEKFFSFFRPFYLTYLPKISYNDCVVLSHFLSE